MNIFHIRRAPPKENMTQYAEGRMARYDEIAVLGQRVGISRARKALHMHGLLTPEVDRILRETRETAR